MQPCIVKTETVQKNWFSSDDLSCWSSHMAPPHIYYTWIHNIF